MPQSHCRIALLAVISVTVPISHALTQSCLDAGLTPGTGSVVQLREAAQADRSALTYRDSSQSAWFVPLKVGPPRLTPCVFDSISYWKIAVADEALTHDVESDLLTFLDLRHVTDVIDARKTPDVVGADALASVGMNYQLALNYNAGRLHPAATGGLNAYTRGWYFNTGLAWNNNGRIARYESYAMRQSSESGTVLRLGDAITSPTALGESLQFAGLSWGTDRTLRPGDFAPVLPTLRSGSALAGPLEVFINDTLQFQQTLQTGVYDLRNVPAQQGFNTYSVRTLDAQGNAVTVSREIYLPSSLLPPGITSWRVDAGFQREDFFNSNAKYGSPLISGSFAKGLNHDSTVSIQALVSQASTSASASYDQRLSALWTSHIGLLAAKKAAQQGSALEMRLDGASRWWRVLADLTKAARPLPGLGDRPALLVQRLMRAQWNGIAGLSLGLTHAQSRRELSAPEEVLTLSASSRVFDTDAVVSAGLTSTRANTMRQQNITVSLLVPLTIGTYQRNQSIYASQSSVDGVQLSRLQYGNNGASPESGNWGLGSSYDNRSSLSSIDANWTRRTEKFELDASARAGTQAQSAQVSMRSGLVWTGGSLFSTRPIHGAFAMVSTGEKDVPVLFENRPAGTTNGRGLLLIPGLIATGINRIRLDPANWPINWTSAEVEKEVVPPLGGGVLVSFRINAQALAAQTFVKPIQPNGKAFPPGTLVYASVDGDKRETVINREGQVWIGELLPAKTFTITYQGKRCDFRLEPNHMGGDVASVVPSKCEEKA